MKIYVINGSPKGKNSITFQTVKLLKALNSEDEFTILHVGNQVKKLATTDELDKCLNEMLKCDLILFSYPVFTFLAPYQLAVFIHNLKKRPLAEKLKGKFVSQITTSKHFYDVTAHRFIKDNCDDLNMKSISGLAADMDDLTLDAGIQQAKDFYGFVKFSMINDICLPIGGNNICKEKVTYSDKVNAVIKIKGFDTVIVTDCKIEDLSLRNMIDNFKSYYKYNCREVNIAEFSFKGGCLGCFDCATDGTCIYNDGFEKMIREEIQIADAVIIAASVTDHSLGPVFKCYDDRQFCNGHRVLTFGKAIGYLLNGRLNEEQNLQDLIESRSEVSHMYLAGTVSYDSGENKTISKNIENLAKSIAFSIENKLTRPQNFYGVGGMKIFRDLIYVMRGLMKEDNAFYKKHSIYNFPQKQKKMILKMKFIGFLMSIPSIKKKSRGMMNDILLKPYKEAIEREVNDSKR